MAGGRSRERRALAVADLMACPSAVLSCPSVRNGDNVGELARGPERYVRRYIATVTAVAAMKDVLDAAVKERGADLIFENETEGDVAYGENYGRKANFIAKPYQPRSIEP